MSLIVELIKERDRLMEAIKAIDVIINYHSTEGNIHEVKAIMNTDMPSNLKLDFLVNKEEPQLKIKRKKTPTGRFQKEFRVGDRFEFINQGCTAADNYLTVGKMYYNREPGYQLVLFDDKGKTRRYSRTTVHNWFRRAGHASDKKSDDNATGEEQN